jgi:hypothetical protein
MAKITVNIPEPSAEYSSENQRQVLQALETLKSQLNFSYQQEIQDDLETFSWFLIGTGRKSHLVPVNNFTAAITGTQLAITVASVTVVLT